VPTPRIRAVTEPDDSDCGKASDGTTWVRVWVSRMLAFSIVFSLTAVMAIGVDWIYVARRVAVTVISSDSSAAAVSTVVAVSGGGGASCARAIGANETHAPANRKRVRRVVTVIGV